MTKPKDIEEVQKFIFEKLKENMAAVFCLKNHQTT